jgi:hypothetical protein
MSRGSHAWEGGAGRQLPALMKVPHTEVRSAFCRWRHSALRRPSLTRGNCPAAATSAANASALPACSMLLPSPAALWPSGWLGSAACELSGKAATASRPGHCRLLCCCINDGLGSRRRQGALQHMLCLASAGMLWPHAAPCCQAALANILMNTMRPSGPGTWGSAAHGAA